MTSRRVLRLLVVAAFLCAAGSARAVQIGDPDKFLSLEIHGFVSPGFLYTTANNYLATSSRGSFEFTEVGLNISKRLVDRLTTGMQLFMRDLGPIGNYKPQFDWFYLDYRWKDWIGFRAGRVKMPFGLYNDSADIDAARTAILLPQSIYPTASRDYLLAVTGAQVYGYIRLGNGGAFDYSLYGGTIFLDLPNQQTGPLVINQLNVRYVVGGRLMWETPVDGLRVGGTVQDLKLDFDLRSTIGGFSKTSTASISALLWVVSMEYVAHRLQLAAEYGRWHVDTDADSAAILPAETRSVSERAFVLATYRFYRWFQPGLYYAVLFPNIEKRSGPENQQHDVALSLRFDINRYWLLKLEGHYMHGTAGLSTSLNDNTPLSALVPDWGLLMAKTTVYF